jgi:anaerobic selenocysteine-containing dehydrogenase
MRPKMLPKRLFTKDQKIHLAPPFFINDLPRLKAILDNPKKDDFPFSLIGRRHLRSNNSWMHNSLRLVKGKNRCTLLIHPNDAEKAGIEDQQMVLVSSKTGKVKIQAELTDTIMESVVSIPHGWGHSKKGTKMKIAEAHAGVSINDLTDANFIDELTGNAAFSGVPVQIEHI